MTVRGRLDSIDGLDLASRDAARDAAVARRAAATAEATAAQARDAASALGERTSDQARRLGNIQAVVERHSSVLEEHTAQLKAIRSSSDTTKLAAKVVTALTVLLTSIAGYLAASKPTASEERKQVTAVVAQAVDGTQDQVRQLVAQTVRELREDDRRKEEAAMVEVRRMLARIEREEAPKRDPDEGIARATQFAASASQAQ